MDSRITKLDGLRTILHGAGKVAVAYSGGVDSTFLLKIAQEELGNALLAVIVDSEVMPSIMVAEAVDNARDMGVDIEVLRMDILTLPGFAGNAKDRCYICKKAIFEEVISLARARGIETVLDGSHSGDHDGDRPGRRALKELGVRSPLTEAGFEKDDVRYFSEQMSLSTARKPASPCLATRIPFYHPITAEKLQQVEEAERTIADLGIEVLRVRHHGTVARIEVLPADMPMILSAKDVIVQKLRELGFTYVDLDLQGYRTGSMSEPLGRKT